MFRTSWKKPSYADKAAGGRQQGQGTPRPGAERRGSSTARPGGGQQGGAGARPTDYVENGRRIREANLLLRDERLSNAARDKFLFNQRIKMEEKRTRLARGNIINFLMDRKSVEDKQVLMNKVLRTAGFKCQEVFSIKLNDYRDSQAEVLLKEGVKWDIEEIEAKLRTAGLNVAVSSFDAKEEVLNIFGLPLTNDIPEMKEKIREALEPFVGRVKDIMATVYNGGQDEEDFFGGLYDGNYKVKVTPLKDPLVQVPNFIVVDKDKKVCAKAIYSKAINEKKNMCTNCYATDHYRDNVLCGGPKSWDTYAEEFELAWREALVKKSEERESVVSEDESSEEGRAASMISELKSKLTQQENRISELETEVEEYKNASDDAVMSDTGGNNNEDQGSLENSAFVAETGSTGGESEEEEASASSATPPTDTDPLTDLLDTDWANEMEAEDLKTNPNKRKDVSPLGGGVEKKNLNEGELRKKFDDLNLQVHQRYDIWNEGGRHTGKLIACKFPNIKFTLTNNQPLVINMRHNWTRLRLTTQGSI